MKKLPSVSVIIPAYNAEGPIAALMESLKRQTVVPYEIIVADNNSTDRTMALAREHGARVVHAKKQGPVHARNRGAEEAKGDVLGFVDADTAVGPKWIECALEHLQDDKKVAVTGPVIYRKEGFEKRSDLVRLGQVTVLRRLHQVLQWLSIGAVGVGSNFFVRSKALREVGGYPARYDKCFLEDVALATALVKAKLGRIIYDPELTVLSEPDRLIRDGVVRHALLLAAGTLLIAMGGHPCAMFQKKGG